MDGCARYRSELSDYAQGRLDPARRTALEEHLAGCPTCRAALLATYPDSFPTLAPVPSGPATLPLSASPEPSGVTVAMPSPTPGDRPAAPRRRIVGLAALALAVLGTVAVGADYLRARRTAARYEEA